jgi:hypothetical protein
MDGGTVYEPETVALLQAVLDDVWSCLLPEQQATISRTFLAARLLRAAARGERDPIRLRDHVLFVVTPPALKVG